MRLLGIDFGGARIGVSVMNSDFGAPRILPPTAATGTLAKDAANLSQIAKTEEVERVIIGVPLSDGEETKMSKICRRLGGEMEKLGWTVEYVDESFTSHEAETEMKSLGLKSSEMRKSVDGEAAAKILIRWQEANEKAI